MFYPPQNQNTSSLWRCSLDLGAFSLYLLEFGGQCCFFVFLFPPRLCFSSAKLCSDGLEKISHDKLVRSPRLWAVLFFFLCGHNGANTLVITHSPSSVFHLCRVPDPQHWGSRQDWVNPSDELQSPWSPHWLLFSAAAQRDSRQREDWQAKQGRACVGIQLFRAPTWANTA